MPAKKPSLSNTLSILPAGVMEELERSREKLWPKATRHLHCLFVQRIICLVVGQRRQQVLLHQKSSFWPFVVPAPVLLLLQ